jgi:hypothetical protein
VWVWSKIECTPRSVEFSFRFEWFRLELGKKFSWILACCKETHLPENTVVTLPPPTGRTCEFYA